MSVRLASIVDFPRIFAVLLLLVAAAGCRSGHPPSLEDDRTPPAALPASGLTATEGELPARLRVATWNLEWLDAEEGRGVIPRMESDYERLAVWARRVDADVIALQEVEGEAAAARIFDSAEYDFHFADQAGPQGVGFAFKKQLRVQPQADLTALALSDLRAGADIEVEWGGGSLRLLSVHLKSGCFDAALDDGTSACGKLAEQLPALEAWIDARAAERVDFAVIGDFNRRLFHAAGDPFWVEIDDAMPAGADLFSPTEGSTSQCWGGAHPVFIDHLVFGSSVTQRIVPRSFTEVLPEVSIGDRAGLSDHCPLRVELGEAMVAPPSAATGLDVRVAEAPSSLNLRFEVPSPSAAKQRIKGNLGKGGVKLYHLPRCPNYARVQVDEASGERWFSSESEAVAAGFRKAGDCP